MLFYTSNFLLANPSITEEVIINYQLSINETLYLVATTAKFQANLFIKGNFFNTTSNFSNLL